ncbi:hypothetical protein LOTGIDRAFT_104367 [Lottia gigantea]|uniref:DUF155 domain-containing protein n=1 Tax=Lottia gigantea TaxID=225164 RepID=V4AKI8_LOTGI|nr:hypothetical protein LOTGIDRAFT_104367 [Lottia gigantea]ESO97622.1 hypothetical protein LOTGIDRAFT_104367 [Lottia gigantea]
MLHLIYSFPVQLQNLKEGIKIKLTQREVLQKTGVIFVFRCKINLSADFLDTPDFYWERDNLESIYQSIYSHLLIGKRTRILNERIELCSDLTHLIHNKLTDKTHIKLEKYIIALILIEVMYTFLFLEFFMMEN